MNLQLVRALPADLEQALLLVRDHHRFEAIEMDDASRRGALSMLPGDGGR